MLNEYKERKLAEFQDKFTLNKNGLEWSGNATTYVLAKFISDLIDEIMEAMPEEQHLKTYKFMPIITDAVIQRDKHISGAGWNFYRRQFIYNLLNKE